MWWCAGRRLWAPTSWVSPGAHAPSGRGGHNLDLDRSPTCRLGATDGRHGSSFLRGRPEEEVTTVVAAGNFDKLSVAGVDSANSPSGLPVRTHWNGCGPEVSNDASALASAIPQYYIWGPEISADTRCCACTDVVLHRRSTGPVDRDSLAMARKRRPYGVFLHSCGVRYSDMKVFSGTACLGASIRHSGAEMSITVGRFEWFLESATLTTIRVARAEALGKSSLATRRRALPARPECGSRRHVWRGDACASRGKASAAFHAAGLST